MAWASAVFLHFDRADAQARGQHQIENGGEKLVHGGGGIVSLRAEQNSAT